MKPNVLVLENGRYIAEVLNPDRRDDEHFYSRYSHAGYILQITDKRTGRKLLSSPKENFDPFSGEGFPDEFETPSGYEEAGAGECFLKIGVGKEQKKSETSYSNHDRHKICNFAVIEAETTAKSLVFSVADSLGDYAYRYTKKIELADNSMIIAHRIKNCGKKELRTLWYSHAFMPYCETLREIYVNASDRSEVFRGAEFAFARTAEDGQRKYAVPLTAEVKRGVCVNLRTNGTLVNHSIDDGKRTLYRAAGNYEAEELQIFINDRVFSAEPKLTIRVAAGETCEWKTEYFLE